METRESTSALVVPVGIQPRNVFGLRTDVKGNVNFTSKQEVIYPVAGVLAIQDFAANRQKFLRFAEYSQPTVITMSPNRKLLAVGEKFEKSWINIYDMSTLKRRKTLHLAAEIPTPEPESICFTCDSKGIAVLTKEPDAFMTIFFFDKAETIVMGRVSNSGQKGLSAIHVACNLSDTGLIAVGGNYTLKLMSRQEKGFSVIGTITGENKIVTSLMWLMPDILLVGTSESQLLIIEGGDPKFIYEADTIDVIDLAQAKEGKDDIELAVPRNNNGQDKKSMTKDVNCLTYFQKGFAYAIKNVLYVFEKESNYRFKRKTILTIPIDIFEESLYTIMNLAINAQMDTVIVTTLHSQIYIGILFVPETLEVKRLEFKTLGEPLHIDRIISMAVCSWKPIIMTAALDQTVRIWNYETGKIELVKKYQIDITVVALHPSGIFVAVGFSDQLRLMAIQLDDLKLIKTFNYPKCQETTFSHQGHMLACGYGSLISIISVFSFNTIKTFEGHNGEVQSLEWSSNDEALISSGDDGAVYEWNIATGQRNNECVEKNTIYKSLQVTSDMSATYVVTTNGLLREMTNSTIVREINVPNKHPLTSIALTRSDLVMFIASEHGHLFNVQIPFLDAGGGTLTNFRFFHNAITKIKITYNDMLLATGSDDGTLIIWTIVNNAARIASMDPDLGQCTDITIPRSDLVDKIETISSLELRIAQQQAEFQYQMRQGDAFHSEQMRDIHTGYCAAIEDLKERNEEIESQHVEELNIVTKNVAQLKDDHNTAIMDLETDFHQKILIEFQKSSDIKAKMDAMREDYETKLRKSAGCLQDTIEALESDFKAQLQERQDLIRELMKEIESKKHEFVEYCRLVENDNDRKMVEFQLQYEKKLKDENEAMLKWRADAGVLSKQFAKVSNKVDDLQKENETLLAEHHKTKATIRNHLKDIEELKKEIEDRDFTIQDKEKRVNDLQKKNQELEKYKQVLMNKITELKEQIEPREREIKEKKSQIAEMETELEGLEQNNLQSELQFSDLTDKYHGTEMELKSERERCRNLRSQIYRICSDIYNISKYVQSPVELKEQVMKLHHRYAEAKSLKDSIQSDAEVNMEYMRQRKHLEKLLETSKTTIQKLTKDNDGLTVELNKLKVEIMIIKTKQCED